MEVPGNGVGRVNIETRAEGVEVNGKGFYLAECRVCNTVDLLEVNGRSLI